MMGMSIEKMYGSYSDADLNDWERFPMNANVLTSSAFGAWLLRRDERRDTSIQADYEKRLKTDLMAILDKIRAEIKALSPKPTSYDVVDGNPIKDAIWEILIEVDKIIDEYKTESEET